MEKKADLIKINPYVADDKAEKEYVIQKVSLMSDYRDKFFDQSSNSSKSGDENSPDIFHTEQREMNETRTSRKNQTDYRKTSSIKESEVDILEFDDIKMNKKNSHNV